MARSRLPVWNPVCPYDGVRHGRLKMTRCRELMEAEGREWVDPDE